MSTRVYFLLAGLFFISFLMFMRGPLHGLSDSRDFKVIYFASSSWVDGNNPYNIILEHKMSFGNKEQLINIPCLYPIITLVIVAPFTYFSWEAAKALWVMINCIAFFGLMVILIFLAQYHFNDWQAILFLTSSFMFYPVHESIAMGQPVILAIFCGVSSLWAAKKNISLWSAILLAFSVGFKPHIGLPFFAFLMIQQKWKIMFYCLGVLLVIGLIGIGQMGWGNFSWFDSWINNVKEATSPGGGGSPTGENPFQYHMLNLHVLLYMVFQSKFIVNYLIISFCIIEVIFLLKWTQKTDDFIQSFAMLNLISIITILSIYHQTYDAAILICLLIFIFKLIDAEYRNYGKLLALGAYPMAIQGPEILHHLSNSGYIPTLVTKSYWWKLIIMPHQIILLLFMSIILIHLLYKIERNSRLELPTPA